MSNSSLVDVTILSPNCNSPRNNAIKKITIHHMAGCLSVERCGELFADPNRQGSSNYGIDSNGRVGLYVDEADRAWTSSSPSNDNQAITIEVANSQYGGDWPVSDLAYSKLIDLCVDICQRNSIERLNFTGDATGNLTMHKYFAATNCPGPYLEARFGDIANKVNERLNNKKDEREKTTMTKEQAELYVQTCFTEYLGRPADKEALEAYSNAIINRSEDDDLTDIDRAIQASDEYKRNFIIKVYNVHLGRDPENEEVIQARMGYTRFRDILADIFSSEEYQNLQNK
jgi:hypothetical protein